MIDFLSTVPFDLLVGLFAPESARDARSTKLLRGMRLIKLVRLVRLLKLEALIEQAAEVLHVNSKYAALRRSD